MRVLQTGCNFQLSGDHHFKKFEFFRLKAPQTGLEPIRSLINLPSFQLSTL